MTRLSRNIIYNLVGQALLIVIGLFAVKNIYQVLGNDAFGIIYFTELITVLIALFFEKSIKLTLVREISGHLHSDSGYVTNLLRSTTSVVWTVFTAGAIFLYVGSPYIVDKWITLSSMNRETAIYSLRILGITSMSAAPRSLYSSILAGGQHMGLSNGIEVSYQGIQRFGIIVVLLIGGHLFHVLYWMAGCSFAAIIVYAIAAQRVSGTNSLFPNLSVHWLKRSLAFNLKILFSAVFSTIQRSADKLIISKLLPVVAVGYYGTIYNFASKVSVPSGAIANAAYPMLSELHVRDDQKLLLNQYRLVHELNCMITIPVTALLWFVNQPLLTYIFDKGTAKSLSLPFFMLLVGFCLSAFVTIPWIFSLACGRPDITARSNFISMIIALPITFFVILKFKLDGAGFAWVLYNIFYCIYGIPYICRDCLKIRTSLWLRDVFKISLMLSFPYFVCWIFLWSFDMLSFIYLLTGFLLSSIGCIVLAWQIMDPNLRIAIMDNLRLFLGTESIVVRYLSGKTVSR